MAKKIVDKLTKQRATLAELKGVNEARLGLIADIIGDYAGTCEEIKAEKAKIAESIRQLTAMQKDYDTLYQETSDAMLALTDAFKQEDNKQ